jgi:capsular polysaccharide biosynthesis protein
LELSGYFGIFRRWWWTLVVAIWVAGLAGFVLGSQIKPTYETQIRLLVGPINTDIDTLRAAGQLVQTYSELTTSQPLLDSVTRELSLPMSTGELRSHIRSTADDVTRLLTIRVTDEDPDRAVDIASTLGDELIQLAAGGTTRPEGELQTVDFPEKPTDPIAPQLSLIVMLAGLGGLVAAIVAVLLVEYVSDAMRSREHLEHLVGAPFLGSVTVGETLTARSQRRLPADGPTAAAYRQLIHKIERSIGGPVKMLAVVGPSGQPAVADAVVAMSIGMAEVSPRVTIVDLSGDVSTGLELGQRPGLHEWLLDPSRPLADLLVGLTRNLVVMPVGSGGVIDSITADQMSRLRDLVLAGGGPLVVAVGSLDTTPAGVVPAAVADAVTVVAVRDRTRRSELRRMTETLRLIGARVAGSLMVEPGDRASRARAAAILPADPVGAIEAVVAESTSPPTVSSTRRRRRTS